MQIVIDIHEEEYNDVKYFGTIVDEERDYIAECIMNGTPLPKGHGRLIDADKFQKDNYFEKRYGHDFYSEFQSRLKRQLTIIEADKAERSE